MCAVNLHNVVTVSKSRLGRHVATLGGSRMEEICAALWLAMGCTSPSRVN